MSIDIILKKNVITISLSKRGKHVGVSRFDVTHNHLSDELLQTLDGLLREHTVEKGRIKKISASSDLPESYMSARILKSLAKIYIFGATAL